MDSFEYAFIRTIEKEGGFSNDAEDRGGRTNLGISEAVFEDALNRMVISGVSDVKDLTVAQAKAIYKVDYWHKIRLGEVKSREIAAEIFDIGVNAGTKRAILITQKALNYLGENLAEDGAMGPITLAAVNKWTEKDKRALLICLNGCQFIWYIEIIKNNPSQKKFFRGWTKRISL